MSESRSGQAEQVRDEDIEPVVEDGAPVAPPSEPVPPSAEETLSLLKQLTVGTIIDGKYQVDSVLGKGAMGVVTCT
jgi:hypothetical protein